MIPLFNFNRRHTEALEKSAKAKERLADAEESIARTLASFLRDESEEPEPRQPPERKPHGNSAKKEPRKG